MSLKRALRRESSEWRDAAFDEIIRSIPPGRVSTYGKVAEAAGYPRLHRAVARYLRSIFDDDLPWHRVLGAGGEIKTVGRTAVRQRLLLKSEGVLVTGKRVKMELHEHLFDD